MSRTAGPIRRAHPIPPPLRRARGPFQSIFAASAAPGRSSRSPAGRSAHPLRHTRPAAAGFDHRANPRPAPAPAGLPQLHPGEDRLRILRGDRRRQRFARAGDLALSRRDRGRRAGQGSAVSRPIQFLRHQQLRRRASPGKRDRPRQQRHRGHGAGLARRDGRARASARDRLRWREAPLPGRHRAARRDRARPRRPRGPRP